MNIAQQINGVINLSLPVIVIFYMFPFLLQSFMGMLLVSALLGLYIWYLNFTQHKNIMNGLLYAPTGEHKEMFEQLIRSCGLPVESVKLKYAYTAEQIAMTMSNTIIIDPTLCSLCDDDIGSDPVTNVYHQMFAPRLTGPQVQRIMKSKEILSLDVQCFIFKHELGHVADNYSTKKLWVIFLIGMFAAYAAIFTAKMLLAINGYLAIFGGMVVGGLTDVFLMYLSNVTFKYFAEKRADLFAAKYSTVDQIEAAAYFFKRHEEILNQHKDVTGFLSNLPSVVLTGHPAGVSRCNYLLKIAQLKKNNNTD